MSISRKITEGAGGGSGGSSKYVDDVFSTYLYEGTGADRDIVNDIDLDDKGGLAWSKCRTDVFNHALYDTERGVNKGLLSNTNSTENTATAITAFNSDGYTVDAKAGELNAASNDYVSWTFAKQEGFFDVVTYTGDGIMNRQIPHNLSSTPGMIIVKSTNAADDWYVWHKDLPNNGIDWRVFLNKDLAASPESNPWQNFPTIPTDSVFYIGQNSVNIASREYVAYVFAHDAPMFGPDGDESIIKCGGYTTNVGEATVELGWEPQWVMIKRTDNVSSWSIFDTMRGCVSTGSSNGLWADRDHEEFLNNGVSPTATGFIGRGPSPANFIYMAIRRPMKPAEEFEPEELFATDNAGPADPYQLHSGFPVDMAWRKYAGGTDPSYLSARLLQGKTLVTNNADASIADSGSTFDFMEGWYTGGAGTGTHSWMFRRAPGFFDVVTYEGDGQAGREIPHNLAVAPEMIWVKCRSQGMFWVVYHKAVGNDKALYLQTNAAQDSATYWNNQDPTDVSWETDAHPNTNTAGSDYIAYLWASVPGICDIGSYTGNGNYQDIDCGFTNGARFVLLKRTDGNGDWMYFDTLRGISNSNSPMLKLNSTDGQNTASFIRPFSGGFQVTANPTGIASAKYIYMAIA